MSPGKKGALALVLLGALAVLGVAGCGNDLGKEADEGVPIQLGDLKFNVQETRSLNPAINPSAGLLNVPRPGSGRSA